MKRIRKRAVVVLSVVAAVVTAPFTMPFIAGKLRKKKPRCGGCLNNCDLDHPGCNIGREKAEKASERRPEPVSGEVHFAD